MSQTTIPATPVAAPPLGEPSHLISPAFLILNLSALLSAVSFSALLPLISRLVTEQTGGGDVAVGFAGGPFLGVTAWLVGATVGAFHASATLSAVGIVLLWIWQRDAAKTVA